MPKLTKEWVETYFDRGVDVANRRVWLDEEIEDATIGTVIRGLYLMETESKTRPVTLFISSFGGSVYEALGLYDAMFTLECPVHTYAYGKCMSAAPLILAAGEPEHRWIAPNCFFMHHDWWCTLSGSGTQMENEMRHLNKVGDTWTHLLAKHTAKDFRWWQARAKKGQDFFFSAQEAIEWGLADHEWNQKEGSDE